MALETLKNVKKINNVNVAELSDFTANRPSEFIVVNHKNNGVSFKIQDGPIKENGLNGCQVVDIIATAKKIIEGLNEKFPCRENSITITKLAEAIMWQEERTKDRESRKVEGTSNA